MRKNIESQLILTASNILNSTGFALFTFAIIASSQQASSAQFFIELSLIYATINQQASVLPSLISENLSKGTNTEVITTLSLLGILASIFYYMTILTINFIFKSNIIGTMHAPVIFTLSSLYHGAQHYLLTAREFKTLAQANITSGVIIGCAAITLYALKEPNLYQLYIYALLLNYTILPLIFFTKKNRGILNRQIADKARVADIIKRYIIVSFWELPTRLIPTIERSIANTIDPSFVLIIESVQRFFTRPVAMLASGSKSIAQNEAIFSQNYIELKNIEGRLLKVLIITMLLTAIPFLIIIENLQLPGSMIPGLVLTCFCIAAISLSDLHRRFNLSRNITIAPSVINTFQGLMNLSILHYTYTVMQSWIASPVSLFISVSFSYLLLICISKNPRTL